MKPDEAFVDRNANITWPDFFPEDCPPNDATLASGRAYRFVRRNPPESSDFQPYRKTGQRYDGDACEASALSILREISDVRHMQRAVPGFRSRQVAVGDLRVGVVKYTPGRTQSHHGWWLPDGASVHEDFVVIGPGEETQ